MTAATLRCLTKGGLPSSTKWRRRPPRQRWPPLLIHLRGSASRLDKGRRKRTRRRRNRHCRPLRSPHHRFRPLPGRRRRLLSAPWLQRRCHWSRPPHRRCSRGTHRPQLTALSLTNPARQPTRLDAPPAAGIAPGRSSIAGLPLGVYHPRRHDRKRIQRPINVRTTTVTRTAIARVTPKEMKPRRMTTRARPCGRGPPNIPGRLIARRTTPPPKGAVHPPPTTTIVTQTMTKHRSEVLLAHPHAERHPPLAVRRSGSSIAAAGPRPLRRS